MFKPITITLSAEDYTTLREELMTAYVHHIHCLETLNSFRPAYDTQPDISYHEAMLEDLDSLLNTLDRHTEEV